jgi:hypothetical protein
MTSITRRHSGDTNSVSSVGNNRPAITATAATDQTRAQNNPPTIEISITMCSAS